MNIDVLGPLRITADDEPGTPLGLPGKHTAAAIAYLTIRLGRAIPLADIAAAIGASGSSSALRTLRTDLRHVAAKVDSEAFTLGTAARLDLPPGVLDSERFIALVDQAQRAWADGDPEGSMTKTCAALALWRSDPYPELADSLDALPTIQRLRSLHLEALELYQEFDIIDGAGFNAVARARELAAAHPERRTFRLQLARALHAAGRHVEALAELRETSAVLGDSPRTRQIATLIARRDPAAATTSVIESQRSIVA